MCMESAPRIAIIGSGIAGLSLSHALNVLASNNDKPSQVDIYEAATQVSEIGAGINIWPRTWRIMQELGLSDALVRFLPFVPDDTPRLVFEIRKADQPEGCHILDYMSNGGTIRLHRRTLQKALLAVQPAGRVHLARRFISYEETEHDVRLYFADGSTETCDLLVGADGIRSTVRWGFAEKHLAGTGEVSPGRGAGLRVGDPVWSGTYAYRGLVPFESLETLFPGHRAIKTPMMYAGKLKHLICYPLPNDGAVNVVAVSTDLAKEGTAHPLPTTTFCDKEEVLSLFADWEPEVQALLQSIARPSKWALMTLVPLASYARGRVLLAGDAAHGMTPHQGAGAGQALDDAYVLAALLARPSVTPASIPRVAEVYDAVRRPEANRVLGLARTAGLVAELVDSGLKDTELVSKPPEDAARVQAGSPGFTGADTEAARGAEDASGEEMTAKKLQGSFGAMFRDWEWVWRTSARDDRIRAVRMLEAALIDGSGLEMAS